MSDQKYENETVYERCWKRIHNNRLLVAILILAGFVISVGLLTRSVKDITGVFRSEPNRPDVPELFLRGVHIVSNPRAAVGPSATLPINYEVEAVVGNNGSAAATHCSAEIQARLVTYQSLSPADLTIAAKTQRPVRFGFQEIELRDVRDGKFLLRCGDLSSQLLPLAE